MTTKFVRRNLNRNVKSAMRKAKLRTVKEDYNERQYDGHDNNSEEE